MSCPCAQAPTPHILRAKHAHFSVQYYKHNGRFWKLLWKPKKSKADAVLCHITQAKLLVCGLTAAMTSAMGAYGSTNAVQHMCPLSRNVQGTLALFEYMIPAILKEIFFLFFFFFRQGDIINTCSEVVCNSRTFSHFPICHCHPNNRHTATDAKASQQSYYYAGAKLRANTPARSELN